VERDGVWVINEELETCDIKTILDDYVAW
jgi:hypothetical protein